MKVEVFVENFVAFFKTTLGQSILFIFIIIATFFLARMFKRLFKKYILDDVLNSNDSTNYAFFQHIIRASIYIAGFGTAMYMIPSLRTFSASLLAGAGIFAVAIGFASQKAVSNIISGLFIVVFKPFRVNDRLTIGNDIAGVVEDITLRHTVLRSYENHRIVIPNALMSDKVVVNADLIDAKVCRFVSYKVDYKTNLKEAINIIRKLAEEHPLTVDNRSQEAIENETPIVSVKAVSWSDYAIILRASIWAKDASDAFTITCDLNESVKEAFDEAGIEIPKGVTLK